MTSTILRTFTVGGIAVYYYYYYAAGDRTRGSRLEVEGYWLSLPSRLTAYLLHECMENLGRIQKKPLHFGYKLLRACIQSDKAVAYLTFSFPLTPFSSF